MMKGIHAIWPKEPLAPSTGRQNIKKYYSLVIAFYCLLIMPFTQPLYAQGVIAGTDIANKVIVSYMIDGAIQTPIESSPTGNSAPGIGNGQPTIFKVDRRIDLMLTGNNDATVSPGDIQSEVTFTLLNEGNAIQEFSLIPDSSLTSDDFDTLNCNIETTGVSGVPLPGVTLPTFGNIKLKPDQQASISVKCDIPLANSGQPLLTGQTSLLSLLASAEKNEDGSAISESTGPDTSLQIDTVFADAAGLDDINRDAKYSARRTYTVSTSSPPPSLSIDKSIVSVVDPGGGNQAITGSEVTYKILINSVGTGLINNIVITDPTPVEMTYKPGSIFLDNTNKTDSSDADNADFGMTTANTATINIGTITAGNQHEIKLTYIIN